MTDYSQGKIYKIVCNETGMIYIGSTVQTLKNRLHRHKSNYKSSLDGKTDCQCASFAIIQFDNYYIELIEHYPCNSKTELEIREGYWQKQIECVNKIIAGAACGDKKAYMKAYIQTDKFKAYHKAYKQTAEHKAHHAEYMRQWRAKKKLELQVNQKNNLDVYYK
jgi:hypothetical protein